MKAVIKRIEIDKELMKNINNNKYYTSEMFLSDAQQYIKAVNSGRMICIIKKVSPSGMSRNLKFMSAEGKKSEHYHRQYINLFLAMGYKEVENTGTFRINGCGMDMVFATNYNIINKLIRLGILREEIGKVLAQKTPNVL